MIKNKIFVTQPNLPPLDEILPYLRSIWDSKILTNCGPLHKELEKALSDYLGVEYISLFSNGTIALMTAIKALGLKGEVITTPFSFVATSHSILWNDLTPVFVDIDPETLNIDPTKIEPAITPDTSAILPVHCYGTPCDISFISALATKFNLKVIYDGAHAFGVKDSQGSVLRYGDLSIVSFHATKVFNTFEGGAIICPDAQTKLNIDQLKNFGFVDEVTVNNVGGNGKMSEIHAAIGLSQIKHIDKAISRREEVDKTYRESLSNIEGITLLPNPTNFKNNYSYFPIFVGPDFSMNRDCLYERLRKNNIYARRYFFPLISEFPMYKHLPSAHSDNLPVATKAANEVLCLPIYPALTCTEQALIIDTILEATHG